MKQILAILLAMFLLLGLCACELDLGSEKEDDYSYTVDDQQMFQFDGLTVSAVAGKYKDDPQFYVANTSDQDYWLVLEAVAYDDVLLSRSSLGIGSVYKVPAGTTQNMADCESYGVTEFYFVTVAPEGFVTSTTTGEFTGSFQTTIVATTQNEIKREYRFAVYSINPDHMPDKNSSFVPKENDLLYRSDLILLQSSDYDESKVTKQLPEGDALFTFNSIKIWKSYGEYSFSSSGNATVSLQSSASYFIDNPSNNDIRVELTLTPDPSRPGKDDAKDDGKDDGKKDETPDPTSYMITCEIPAGKASRNMNTSQNIKTPSWLKSGGLIMDIRIYDLATGALMIEASVNID